MIHTAWAPGEVWAPGEQAHHLVIRGFTFATIEPATEPNAFTPDVAGPTTHETGLSTRTMDRRAAGGKSRSECRCWSSSKPRPRDDDRQGWREVATATLAPLTRDSS